MILKNVEKKENNTAAFVVESDANEFAKAVNDAYLKNRSSISIPGFRKSKAPRAVIEGMYGPEVFYQDAMDELAPEAYEFGLKESGLKTVGAPAISDVNITEEKTVAYTFSVSVYPEVTLGQYKGLEAVKASVEVSDEDVEKELNATRKRNARMLDIDDREARMGDTANIDFDGYLNGERFDGGKAEGYALELGSNSFVPGFEEQVAGMKIGEEKDLDITFPEEYVENLAGKAFVFKVTLKGITENELPELDDEFAKKSFGFDTVQELRDAVKEEIENDKKTSLPNLKEDRVVEEAGKRLVLDEVPEAYQNQVFSELANEFLGQLGRQGMNLDMYLAARQIKSEDFLNDLREQATERARQSLALDAIARKMGFDATEDDVKAEFERAGVEEVETSIAECTESGQMPAVRESIRRTKAVKWLVENATVTEVDEIAEARSKADAE